MPRFSRSYGGGGRPRSRRRVFWLAVLAALLVVGWFLPQVIVLTDLRDRPLQMALAGIDGRVTSRSATWTWLRGIEYRNIVLSDRTGRPVLVVKRAVSDHGLVGLALDPTHLGTVRLIGGEALVEIRRGGSNLEDILAPFLAAVVQSAAVPMSFELEVVDGAIELVDLERRDAWRITDVIAAGAVRPDAALAGWTISGRVLHAGEPVRDLTAAVTRPPPPAPPGGPAGMPRLDRTTIAAGATATLARDGGWSISSPEIPASDAPRTLAVAGNRVPLGVSSVWATRFDAAHLLDGLADVRLDISLPPPQRSQPRQPAEGVVRIAGMVSGSQLAVCRSDTLAELVALDRCEIPFDLSSDGRTLSIRNLKASSPLFKAEASGRIGLPRTTAWEWAESLIGDDFALVADIDLTAAAKAIPGGLTVRPDVRVTAGQLQLSAAAHADGNERVLEVRASSRDLAAVQGERQLRWNDPFTAWLRGRRGPARGDRLRIDEARVASPAIEVSATGTAETSSLQWTIDIDKLVQEAAEVLDLHGLKIAGSARGQIDLGSTGADAAATARVSASLSNFEFSTPGGSTWSDEEISLEGEASGGVAGGALLVDAAHALVVSGDDRLEMTLTGGAIVNPGAAFQDRGAAWVRPAPQSDGLSADWSLAGDLGRWQPRLEALVLGQGGGMTFGGRVRASAALAARGDVWQVTRAGAEIEKLTATDGSREISEPRLVASAAGLFNPSTGQIEVSSAEILTATLSLRTGGLAVRPEMPRGAGAGTLFDLVERLRGRAQWQADVGRLEKWLVAAPQAARWPAGGRAWGTAEIIDTPAGLNLLIDATGNQLALTHLPAAAAAPREVWAEPRARFVVEVTRGQPTAAEPQSGDTLVINRFALESSTIAVAAAGSVSEWSSRRLVDLGGSVNYDWEMLSRLLSPWTGGRVRLAGGGARPFAVRAPLGMLAAAAFPDSRPALVPRPQSAGGDAATPESVPLPEDWLSAVRGQRDAGSGRVTLPVAAGQRPAGSGATEWLRGLSIDTSAAWTAADVDGFQFDAGEMSVRLFEGQLALGPFEIAAAGGRLRGAPWIKLLPLPGELVVPPGRAIDRVALSSRLCDQWISWVAPLIGKSARVQGVASVDLAGARLPLDDPFGGELSGQIIFENLEVTPGPQFQPLATLIVKLQSLIDPRFAFGDKVVLLRVRPEPVRMKLSERRLWHEGLVMDMGELVVRSGGSVGDDGSLAMTAEVSFRGDLAGSTPIVAQLLRTPLLIPLRGTVHRPQFDAGSIDKIVGRIVENTAEAVINDGLTRGLENLFGNPQPPAGAPK
jgi:translocation and assembly module TamB